MSAGSFILLVPAAIQ